MNEPEVRTLMNRAYQCDCHCKAAIVDPNGSIRALEMEDREGYSRRVERANTILQLCQSRLQRIYQQRRQLQQGLVLHHWISHLAQLKSATQQAATQ